MQILDILAPRSVQVGIAATSKKRALELAAGFASRAVDGSEDAAEKLFEALLARERLGSTALGDGVAVPHCRLEACTRATGLLLRLADGVDFDAPDGQPVDLLFVLVVPAQATDEHLQLLGAIATMFNDPDMRANLRAAEDGPALLASVEAFERGNAAG